MVDKNLFLYDLAIVAIMKNEGRYLKEWLDYHLAAGVEHFYIYDNDSTDNQREIAAPYVKAGLVDYINAPGRAMQVPVYNEALKHFKFQCRYIAFVDCDEFIYPKAGGSITEAVDEILSRDENAAALVINWQCFGSNGQEKADYSRGVLERFTRRAHPDWEVPIHVGNLPGGNTHVKTIANPRAVHFFRNPHFAVYFNGLYAVNENGTPTSGYFNKPVTAEKIVLNHYFTKSRQEYSEKVSRGRAARAGKRDIKDFERFDRNEIFDDGILRYRDARADNLPAESYTQRLNRSADALMENLSPALSPNASPKFFAGKIETFLTCRAVAAYLKTNLPDAEPAIFFEEEATKALLPALRSTANFSEAQLFISELPELLSLQYPAAKELHAVAKEIIPQMMEQLRLSIMWRDYLELDYLLDILTKFGA